MKFHFLTLKNFLAHADLELQFEKPITVLVGPHQAGKTSVAQAMGLCLLGTTRGLFKKDRHFLSRGADPFRVTAEGQHGEQSWHFMVTPSNQSPTSNAVQTALQATPKLLEALVDWKAWREMSIDDRRKLLFSISGVTLKDEDQYLTEVNATRRSKGVLAALRLATERRRETERLAKELGEPQPPESKVTIADKEFDLPTLDLGVVRSQRLGAENLAKKAMRQKVQAEVMGQNAGEQLKAYRTRAAEEPMRLREQEEVLAKLKKAAQASEKAAQDDRAARDLLSRMQADLQDAQNRLQAKVCPTCGKGDCPCFGPSKAALTSRLGDLKQEVHLAAGAQEKTQAAFVDAREAMAQLDAERLDIERALRVAQEAKASAKKLEEDIEAAKKEGLNPESASLHADRTALNARNLQDLERAVFEWQVKQEDHRKNLARFDKVTGLAATWGEQEAALKTEVEGGGSDAASLFANKVKEHGEFWGWGEIEMGEDLLPRLAGRPFPMLCKSEQYVASLCVVAGLAWISGVRWFIADDLDELVSEARARFVAWSDILAEDMDQVIGIAAGKVVKSWSEHRIEVRPFGA